MLFYYHKFYLIMELLKNLKDSLKMLLKFIILVWIWLRIGLKSLQLYLEQNLAEELLCVKNSYIINI